MVCYLLCSSGTEGLFSGPMVRGRGGGEGEWYWGSNLVIFEGWSGSILIVGWWVMVVWSGGSYLVVGVLVRAGGRGCCWHHPGSFFCGLSLVSFCWSCRVLLFAYWVCCAGCCWSVSHYCVYICWFFGTALPLFNMKLSSTTSYCIRNVYN